MRCVGNGSQIVFPGGRGSNVEAHAADTSGRGDAFVRGSVEYYTSPNTRIGRRWTSTCYSIPSGTERNMTETDDYVVVGPGPCTVVGVLRIGRCRCRG